MKCTPMRRLPIKAREFVKFCIVGSGGFVIDATILTLLVKVWFWQAPAARVLSFVLALTFTWAFNRSTTFRSHRPASVHEWLRYAGLMCVGAAINYSVFLGVYTFADSLRQYPWAAVGAGSAAAMLVNYFSMRALFTSPPTH